MQRELSPADRQRLDDRLRRDPLVYADAFPERWAAFRRLRLADLVARVRGAVHRARPDALVTAAVIPDAREAYEHKLQDWPDWARRGLIDAFCPMAYTASLPVFNRQVAAARAGGGAASGLGRHRRLPADPGADHRSHRRRPQRRRGRRGALQLRQHRRVDGAAIPSATSAAWPSRRRAPPPSPRHPPARSGRAVDDAGRLSRRRRLSRRHHRLRQLARPVPPDHGRLLPHRPVRAGLGDLLHHRRHRDQHAVVHRRAGRGLRRRLRLPAARRRLHPRPGPRRAAAGAGLLRRRSADLLRPAAPALRAGGQEPQRRAVHRHALARRRHPPVRDGAGDRRGDRHPGQRGRRRPRPRDDRLHDARRRRGRHLDRRDPAVRLPPRRRHPRRVAAVAHQRRLERRRRRRHAPPASSTSSTPSGIRARSTRCGPG